MNAKSRTIIKDENDAIFVAQVAERVARATDMSNSLPISDFFRLRKRNYRAKSLVNKHPRHATI